MLGVGLSWDRPRVVLSSFFGALGLLVKPTTVVALVLFILHKEKYKAWFRNIIWMLIAISISLLYYTLGMKLISRFMEQESLFAVNIRSPIHSILEFILEFKRLGLFCFESPFLIGGILLVVLG